MSRIITSPEYGDNGRRKRSLKPTAKRAGAIVTAAVALSAGAVGLNKYSNEEHRGTQFANSADAIATLQANATAHGYDEDDTAPAQGKMERDLRGADPLIMQDLGNKVVSANAVSSGEFKTPDGRTVTLVATPGDSGDDIMSVEVKTPDQGTDQTLLLDRDNKGNPLSLIYDSGPIDTSNFIGGPHFDYNFKTNELDDSNTFQHANGKPITNTPGAAIIVNSSMFDDIGPAGPATETIVQDVQSSANDMFGAVEQLPRK